MGEKKWRFPDRHALSDGQLQTKTLLVNSNAQPSPWVDGALCNRRPGDGAIDTASTSSSYIYRVSWTRIDARRVPFLCDNSHQRHFSTSGCQRRTAQLRPVQSTDALEPSGSFQLDSIGGHISLRLTTDDLSPATRTRLPKQQDLGWRRALELDGKNQRIHAISRASRPFRFYFFFFLFHGSLTVRCILLANRESLVCGGIEKWRPSVNVINSRSGTRRSSNDPRYVCDRFILQLVSPVQCAHQVFI